MNSAADPLGLRQGYANPQGAPVEQLRLLYNQIPPVVVAHNIVASLLVWLYWDHGTVSHTTLSIWLGLSFATLGARLLAIQAFRRLPPINEQRILMYRQGAAACALLLGVLTGYASIMFNPVLFPPDSTIVYDQAVMLALIAGLAIVGMASYVAWLPALFAFLLPTLMPGAIYLGLSGSPTGELLFFVNLLFTAFLVYTGLRINQITVDGLTLQSRNQSLITYLDRARSDAEALNSNLSREISERKKAQQTIKDAHDRLEALVEERTSALQGAYDELERNRERLALAMEASDIGLWDWDLVTDEIFHSNFDRMLGYDQAELKTFHGHLQPLVHRDDYPQIRAAMIEHLKGRTNHYHMVYRTRHKNGSWHWVEDHGRVVSFNDEGRATRMIGTRRDVTARQEAEEKLRLAATVFESAAEGIYIFDRHLRIIDVNATFSRITGWRRADVVGHSIADFIAPEQMAMFPGTREQLERDGHWEGEIMGQRKNGESYPLWLRIDAVRNERTQITHYVSIFSDLTARRESEEKLRYLSNYDRLTGLANRALFRDRLHAAISGARGGNTKFALFMMDLDRFKQINDTLGHEYGDKLLHAAATRLMSLGIPADTISRIGGDEFTIIIEQYTDRAQLEKIAIQIIEAIRMPFHIDDQELLLGASVGITLFPEHGKELQILINHADTAVQQAKHLGGNNFRFYAGESRTAHAGKLALETSLRKAILRDEFIIHYQPKYDLATERIYGVEALVRWQHPARGMLLPKDFIPLAEETGLIASISELVLERSARQASAWRDVGLGDIRLSVNLSAHQMRKGDLIEVVERVLAGSGLAPGQLELEITESQLMEDVEGSVRMLRKLRALGITISLDDFGTGYSSLSYLQRFPITTVKIDQSFVRDVHKGRDNGAIVRAIIAMSHSLGLQVIAEGVETTAQLEVLRQAGCDAIQGFLIGPAVSEADLLQLLRTRMNVA